MGQRRYTKFCGNCGTEIAEETEVCPKCGAKTMSPPGFQEYEVAAKKSEVIAASASFVFPGLGQIYNGQIGKGIMYGIIGLILLFSIAFLIGIILYPVFWIYNIFDAYKSASRINRSRSTSPH